LLENYIKFLKLTEVMVKKYVCIPRSFLVINVCNQGKTLCSPCVLYQSNTTDFKMLFYYLGQHVSTLIESFSGPFKIQTLT